MSLLTDANRSRQCWLATMLLGGFILLAWVPWHSRAKVAPRPAGVPTVITRNLSAGAAGGESQALMTACAPFIYIVSSQDGTKLFICISCCDKSCVMVCVNTNGGPGIWPACDQCCCTMSTCVITVSGLTPGMSISGSISITSTLGLDTGTADFIRAYVPASTTQSVNSIDGNLQLVVYTDTFPSETYVAVVPSYGPPSPPPLGYRFVGSVYSVRAAGNLVETDRPMSLRLYYNETALAGADPHTLAIFAWDAYNKRWDNLGGTLFSTQQYLSVATSRFGTYALMATPSWRDEFDDISGMDFSQFNNVTWGGSPENRTLILVSTATSGGAVSQPITPTTDFAHWGSLTFTRTVDPPTTALTVDVLSPDGSEEVLTDVTSGADLASLVDPAQYPSLRLRVNMSSTVAGETPALDMWQLAWQVEEYKVYLPVVLR